MDSRTIHQFQNYSSSWHSYWLLGCIHRSSCCIYKWSAPRVRTFVYRSKSNTSNTQTVDWIIHPNPNPSHLYPTCIPYIYIYVLFTHDIPMFQIHPNPSARFSCSGPLGRMPVPRASWPRHPPHGSPDPYTERLRSDCQSGRASLPPLTEGGGNMAEGGCRRNVEMKYIGFFIFDGPNHVVSPLALRVSCGSDASWCAILRKKWVPPSQHRGAFQSAGSSNLSKASFLQRATVPSLLVTWLNSKPKAWQAFSFKFAKNGVKSYGIWQRIHQTFWIIISLTYTT